MSQPAVVKSPIPVLAEAAIPLAGGGWLVVGGGAISAVAGRQRLQKVSQHEQEAGRGHVLVEFIAILEEEMSDGFEELA